MPIQKPPATPQPMLNPTPGLTCQIEQDPDLVDRIFEYLMAELPQMAQAIAQHKPAVRAEFRGEDCHIRVTDANERHRTAMQVLSLFNGRNATEIARRLRISRATVYRILKQPGSKA